MASTAAIPADDPSRKLSVASPDDPTARHISLVGDVYARTKLARDDKLHLRHRRLRTRSQRKSVVHGGAVLV
jgi:hypothetical protein